MNLSIGQRVYIVVETQVFGSNRDRDVAARIRWVVSHDEQQVCLTNHRDALDFRPPAELYATEEEVVAARDTLAASLRERGYTVTVEKEVRP